MRELILGIDDAGRGPVIGPMILAGCLIDKKHEQDLKKMGVKDSKLVTPKRRGILEDYIKKTAETFEISICTPEKIDSSQNEGIKLNELEAEHFIEIINKINVLDEKIKIVIDCPSVSLVKFAEYLKMRINNLSTIELSCEHKADLNHVSVSCASILAKCERERQMDKLKSVYGSEIGSGYPSDPLTIRFLEKNVRKYKDKGIFRKCWATYKKAYEKTAQETLF